MALKVSESAKLAYYTVIPKELEAFWALQGALEPRGGQIGPPDGAHMQVKWPLGPPNFVYFPPKAKFDRHDGHFTNI